VPLLLDPADVENTLRLFHAGVSADEIGDILGVGGRAIHYRLRRRGLRYPHRASGAVKLAAEVRRGRIYLMRGGALTVPQMAGQLGVRTRTLRAWMTRHVPEIYEQMKAEASAQRAAKSRRARRVRRPASSAPMPLTRWRRAAIKAAYLAGYSAAAIARRYHQAPVTIWRLLRRQRVPPRPPAQRSPRWLEARRPTHGVERIAENVGAVAGHRPSG
jgi:IS30 family transposase